MAASLRDFKASELADVLGEKLGRGRPSLDVRLDLEERVRAARAAGEVRVKKGKLVRVSE